MRGASTGRWRATGRQPAPSSAAETRAISRQTVAAGRCRAPGRRGFSGGVQRSNADRRLALAALARCAALPPVDVLVVDRLLDEAGDDLDVRADAARPAELPQLPSGALVVVDDLVDVVDVERAGAARVDRAGDVLEQDRELGLVVARPRARGRRGAQTWNPRPKDRRSSRGREDPRRAAPWPGGDLGTRSILAGGYPGPAEPREVQAQPGAEACDGCSTRGFHNHRRGGLDRRGGGGQGARMEPISLTVAAIVAAVAAKASDRCGRRGRGGWGGRVAPDRRDRVRERFSRPRTDGDASKALELVEQVPDSKRAGAASSPVAVDRHVLDEPAFAARLAESRRAGAGGWRGRGVRSRRIALGDQVGADRRGVHSSTITVTHASAVAGTTPRTECRGRWWVWRPVRAAVGVGQPERPDQQRHRLDDPDHLRRSRRAMCRCARRSSCGRGAT